MGKTSAKRPDQEGGSGRPQVIEMQQEHDSSSKGGRFSRKKGKQDEPLERTGNEPVTPEEMLSPTSATIRATGELRKVPTGKSLGLLKSQVSVAKELVATAEGGEEGPAMIRSRKQVRRRASSNTSQLPEERQKNSILININDKTPKAKSNYVRTTKYRWWNFFFKNLFEQFMRIANFYFLLTALITLVPGVSPIAPVTTWAPLIFVLGVSMVKEGYEDFLRFRADLKVNNRPVMIVRDGKITKKRSRNIRQGDIVFVQRNQTIPSDLVVFSSNDESGECYVETSNLDGESNHKLFKALPVTASLQSLDEILRLRGTIECEQSTPRLDKFFGKLQLRQDQGAAAGDDIEAKGYGLRGQAGDGETQTYSLDQSNLLLRGATLVSTKWIFGIAVYTGHNTKLMKNMIKAKLKRSMLEKVLNKIITAIFFFQFFCCLLSSGLSGWFHVTYTRDNDYMNTVGDEDVWEIAGYNMLTFFLLYNIMIPISLIVTFEIIRLVQAGWVQWDLKMCGDVNDYEGTRLRVRTSNLMDDLGQIEYIFSDKTGTLTENQMVFAKASVGGEIFNELERPGSLWEAAQRKDKVGRQMKEFLEILSVCHTVVPELKKAGEGSDEEEGGGGEKEEEKQKQEKDDATGGGEERVLYQAQSPDEKALVETAQANGFEFYSSKANTAAGQKPVPCSIIRVRGEGDRFYELKAVLEFNSDRKRQSSIVKCPDGTYKIVCKGADNVMMERIKLTGRKARAVLQRHLNSFAEDGLRTLIVGSKTIDEKYFNDWYRRFQAASESLVDRERKVEAVSNEIENDFDLVGSTAVEDRLQDEVPETLDYLLKAGIMIWVLTGDKQETAINIGYSSSVLQKDAELIILNAASADSARKLLDRSVEMYGKLPKPANAPPGSTVRSMVIDGPTLGHVLKDDGLIGKFLVVAQVCKSVILCRATPGHKAEIVKMVRKRLGKTTLAIGDGANDVSMIKKAHIGVGVAGREGTQAVLASDFAINKFRFLKRLLVVHGRYSYVRNALFIQYFLYKNMMFVFGQFYFATVNGYSGQIIHDSYTTALYNTIFAAFAPVAYALFEKDVEEHIIDANPGLYKRLTKGPLMNLWTMALWLLNAFFHCSVCYYGCYAIFQNDIMHEDGWNGGLWFMSTIYSSVSLVVVNLKMGLETRYWTWVNHTLVWGSIAIYFCWLVLYSALGPVSFTSSVFSLNLSPYWYVFYMCCESPVFWLACPLLVVAALLPDYTMKYYRRRYHPIDYQVLQEEDRAARPPQCCGYELPCRPRRPAKTADADVEEDEETGRPAEVASTPVAETPAGAMSSFNFGRTGEAVAAPGPGPKRRK